MKLIGITQRVERVVAYAETRDALDRRWSSFCLSCNLLPLPCPNHLPTLHRLLEKIDFEGFIFSGGDSLHLYGGTDPERDAVERFLLEYAIERNIPVLGVCRGMQLIQHFFGVPLEKIKGHAGQEHTIIWKDTPTQINSFHHYGAKETTEELIVLAQAQDGVVEAIKHRRYPLNGIMWHPERSEPFEKRDQALFSQIFGGM